MMTVEPFFGAFLRLPKYSLMAISASGLVTTLYAMITYLTPVFGSFTVVRTFGSSMLGRPLRLFWAGAYGIGQGQEHRDDAGLAAAEGELAQGADVRGLHAVNADRVAGVCA